SVLEDPSIDRFDGRLLDPKGSTGFRVDWGHQAARMRRGVFKNLQIVVGSILRFPSFLSGTLRSTEVAHDFGHWVLKQPSTRQKLEKLLQHCLEAAFYV